MSDSSATQAQTQQQQPTPEHKDSSYPKICPCDLPENYSKETMGTWKGAEGTINYKAIAGTIQIDTPKLKPACSVFSVSFQATDEKGNTDPTRPVTFIFNGGPGGDTCMLLMGSFGPQRIYLPDINPGHGAPYELQQNNPFCLLPVTDLVFIDAPGTGFSVIATDAQKELWGVDGDRNGFSQFIQRWCSENGRWNSPKYLIGESYGTTRASLLTLQMQNDNIALTGATLLSNILDYSYIFDLNDELYIGYFPTFAMIAQYHGRAGQGKSREEWAQEAREFTEVYRRVLSRGDKISADVRDKVAKKYAEMTGLMEEYVKRSNLRVPDMRFRKELLADEDKIVGRYDGRVAGYDQDPCAAQETFIVDAAFISPGYETLCESYLREQLGYDPERLRNMFATFLFNPDPSAGWNWLHINPPAVKGDEWGFRPFPNTLDDLACAIKQEPELKIMLGNGYYDMATPFHQTEYDIDHIGLPEPLAKNIAFKYYPSGHMIYTNDEALTKLHADMLEFYRTPASGMANFNERPEMDDLKIDL